MGWGLAVVPTLPAPRSLCCVSVWEKKKGNILLRSVLLASRLYCVARFLLPREQLGVSCAAGACSVARNASFAVDTGVRPKCNATLTELGHGLQRQSWLHIWEELKLPRCNQGFFIFIAE